MYTNENSWSPFWRKPESNAYIHAKYLNFMPFGRNYDLDSGLRRNDELTKLRYLSDLWSEF